MLAVFRLIGQPKRDASIIFMSCESCQSPAYPIMDAFAVVAPFLSVFIDFASPASGVVRFLGGDVVTLDYGVE